MSKLICAVVPGQRLRDDRAHLRLGPIDLVLGEGAQVAASHCGSGDDVGLAGGVEADLPAVQLRRRAAADQADIVGQLVLGQLAAESVDDPRQLVDGAIARRCITPLEWPLRPLTVKVQLSELRRAIEPMSGRPSAPALEVERDVRPFPASISGPRVTSIGSPASSSSPVSTTWMSASSACRRTSSREARRSSPPYRPCRRRNPGFALDRPCAPSAGRRWSGSNTVSRWPISSMRLPRPLALWCATMCPARPARFMSIQSTLKPSGSSSARSIRPTASTPGEFRLAAVLVHPGFEHGDGAFLLRIDRPDHALLGPRKLGSGG